MDDELQCLQSVYCQPGEFSVTEYGNGKQITVKLCQNTTDKEPAEICVNLRLPDSYPNNIPDIQITSSQIHSDKLKSIRKNANEYANEHQGDNMIFDILNNIQENVDTIQIPENTCSVCKNEERNNTREIWNVLLSLDHMRAKAKYIKTIQKWTEELDIKGRLLFFGKFIFILLQGEYGNIKEYITRQKTVNVDVDSHGRSCKERMLSVICEEKSTGKNRFTDFSVEDCDSMDKLEQIFSDVDLTLLFCKYIKNVYL